MKRTWPYDMWSLGVTWLEIVMGTPHVFQVDPRTRAKLYHQLHMEAMSEVSPEILKCQKCKFFVSAGRSVWDTIGCCFPASPPLGCP